MAEGLTARILDAVAEYVSDRCANLAPESMVDPFKDGELERLKLDRNGYLEIEIGNLEITETDEEDEGRIWYVQATIFFEVTDGGESIEGSTDTYQCYQGNDGAFIVDWHSS